MSLIIFFSVINIIIFTIIFVLIKEFERFISFKRSNDEKYSIFITIILMFNIFIWSLNDQSFIFVNYISYFYLVTFMIFFNRKKFIIPMVFFFIINFILMFNSPFWKKDDFYLYFRILEPILLITIFWISNYASNKKILYFLINYSFILIFAIVSFILINYSNNMVEKINIYLYSLFLFLYFIIQFIIIYYVDIYYKKVVDKQNEQYTRYSSFISPNFYESKLKNFIKQNKIKIGAFVNIKIEKDSIILDQIEILNLLIKKIKKNYSADIIFFQKENNSYNFFLPLDEFNYEDLIKNNYLSKRTSNDIFDNLNKIAEDFINLKIKFMISFYGIESFSFEDLFLKNEFLYSNELNINYKNNVWIYNNRLFYDYLINKNMVINFLENNNILITTNQIKINNEELIQKNYEIVPILNSNFNYVDTSVERFIFLNILKNINQSSKDKYIFPELNLLWIYDNVSYIEKRIQKYLIKKENIYITINSKKIDLEDKIKMIEEIKNHFNLYLINWTKQEYELLSENKNIIFG